MTDPHPNETVEEAARIIDTLCDIRECVLHGEGDHADMRELMRSWPLDGADLARALRELEVVPEGIRVKTGPLKFGDDWTGYFLRGDAALDLANAIDAVLEEGPVGLLKDRLAEWAENLRQVRQTQAASSAREGESDG